jgi:malonyl-CoA O-methyltransferase
MVTLRHWHRVLAVDGFLMFTTLGPGSLGALRQLYAEQDWGAPMAPLVDMHDLGDMLVEAGFADPVMDQEILRLTWRNASDALAELRSIGSNAALERACGCRTPRWRRQLEAGLERVATRQGSGPDAGTIELAFEVVYGHAFKPQPRPRVAAETTLQVTELRAMLRGPRRASS